MAKPPKSPKSKKTENDRTSLVKKGDATSKAITSHSPRAILKARRPERFSDSRPGSSVHLDRALLEFHLSTLTSRNQEIDFEGFAYKLAQKEICPNLVPNTGPMGGGDSKVDTETYPVASNLAFAWLVGTPGANAERWAFAFSTKAQWKSKLKDDIQKIVDTNRGYIRAYFISSQTIPAKKRSAAEDELRRDYGISVTVLDRSWILDRVFEFHHETLAVNELHIAVTLDQTVDIGPNDTQRLTELQAIESALALALAEVPVRLSVIQDSLRSAVLARELERPRSEIDAHLGRARRIAKQFGSPHQRLVADYESAWTAYWWFEDFEAFSSAYDAVEARASGSNNIYELELLNNLNNVARGAVVSGQVTAKVAKLSRRTKIITAALERVRDDESRPSASLTARVFLAWHKLGTTTEATWGRLCAELRDLLKSAQVLIGFALRPLVEMIMEFGQGDLASDPEYDKLFEDVASLMGSREGEITTVRLLVERGIRQLDAGRTVDAIRTLGRTLVPLYKHETRRNLVFVVRACGAAYERMGLLWAARGSYLMSVSLAMDEFWTHEHITSQQAIAYHRLKWIELRLGRVPHALAWHEADVLVRHALEQHGNSEDPGMEELGDFDAILGILFLRSRLDVLKEFEYLPDVLKRLNLARAELALRYALGDEAEIVSELGERTPPIVPGDFFRQWRDQPAAESLPIGATPLIGTQVRLQSTLSGCQLSVSAENRPPCVEVAESFIAALEAILATGLSDRLFAVSPNLLIRVGRGEANSQPIVFRWVENTGSPVLEFLCIEFNPHENDLEVQGKARESITEAVFETLARIFSSGDVEKSLGALLGTDRAHDRALNFTSSLVVIGNALGRDPKFAVSAWTHEQKRYPLARTEQWDAGMSTPLQPWKREEDSKEDEAAPGMDLLEGAKHSDLRNVSLIRNELWIKAKWQGVAYLASPRIDEPMAMALLFEERDSAEAIFADLVEQVGNENVEDRLRISILRGINADEPLNYRVMIGSNLPSRTSSTRWQLFTFACQMKTVSPESLAGLESFVSRFERLKKFVLMPAVIASSGDKPALIPRHSIVLRQLIVQNAWQVGPNDQEVVALYDDDKLIIPDGVSDAPALKALEQRRRRREQE